MSRNPWVLNLPKNKRIMAALFHGWRVAVDGWWVKRDIKKFNLNLKCYIHKFAYDD